MPAWLSPILRDASRTPSHDIYTPLMSLPRIFNTQLNTIPAAVPYLYAARDRIRLWKRRIRPEGIRVGVVWAGNPAHENDANRSASLEEFLPLTKIDGIHMYGLQKGNAAVQAAQLPPPRNFTNLGAQVEDLADTAGIIENLDLVISVDTAVAHLAGAMAKPVWVLVPANPDWRWLLDREDSPWYPTMRLFRSPVRRSWDPVFRRLRKELLALTGMHRQK